jgi:hypothetical protein
MGLLVGILVGLSISPVVGGVIAALTALVGALLGLTDKLPGQQGAGADLRVWRIGAFGCACAVAVVLGVGLRAHDWLGKSPRDRVTAWTNAGFTKERALQLVEYSELGIAPGGAIPSKGQVAVGPRSGVLFGAPGAACSELASERFANDTERLRAFDNIGGEWRTIASGVRSNENEGEVLEAVWQLACKQSAP